MSDRLPSRMEAKKQARELKQELAAAGTPITHAAALENVAKILGFRDWNTCNASLDQGTPKAWSVGERVAGTYLSQSFTARVIQSVPKEPGWVFVALELDKAVDVITFEGMTNFRKRITGVVGPKGHSAEKTSDGQPHLVLTM